MNAYSLSRPITGVDQPDQMMQLPDEPVSTREDMHRNVAPHHPLSSFLSTISVVSEPLRPYKDLQKLPKNTAGRRKEYFYSTSVAGWAEHHLGFGPEKLEAIRNFCSVRSAVPTPHVNAVSAADMFALYAPEDETKRAFSQKLQASGRELVVHDRGPPVLYTSESAALFLARVYNLSADEAEAVSNFCSE